MLTTDFPEPAGLDGRRLATALDLAAGWCERDRLPAAAIVLGRSDWTAGPYFLGRQRLGPDSPPLRDDAIFLVASITKPVVATAALMLIEQGRLALGDRVAEFLADFAREGKIGVTVRHLLTHTSGLPDMLPDNRDLRAANAPLSAFVEQTCRLRPLFPPGRGVQYQSMGFAVLGEIIASVSGKPLPGFLRDELFAPLGMHETALGAPEAWLAGPDPLIDRIPEIRLPPDQQDATGWNWNSAYWRRLGAPWGGLLTTPADLAKFAQMVLRRGMGGSTRMLNSAAVEAALRNQLSEMRDIPADDRRCRPWGLGWRLNWPAHGDTFGDLLSPSAVGHWGATGTLLWIDPARDAFAAILTTQPTTLHGRPLLIRLSNLLTAAFERNYRTA